MTRRLLVLGWHNVEPTYAFPGGSGEGARHGLERQMRFLGRWANVVPLGTALQVLYSGGSLPPRAVALTFDDGYRDQAEIAAPLAHRYRLPATFFLVPAFLSGTVSPWWEDLAWAFTSSTAASVAWGEDRYDLGTAGLRSRASSMIATSLKLHSGNDRAAAVEELISRLRPQAPRPVARDFLMSWDHAHSLVALGHDVGSHTRTHCILSRETAAARRQELATSRSELENRLQVPATLLAYPNGREIDYGRETVEAAAEAGYAAAVTTIPGLATSAHSPFEVRRLVVDPLTDLPSLLLEAARTAKRSVKGGLSTLLRPSAAHERRGAHPSMATERGAQREGP